MQFTCQHCRTPLQDDARACDRCGAPLVNGRLDSVQTAPAGYATLDDMWRGLRLHYPQGWNVLFPSATVVAFEAPDESASLALVTLPDASLGGAEQVARSLVKDLPNVELRSEGHNSDTQATVQYRSDEGDGRVLVRLSQGSGFALFADRKAGANRIDVGEPFRVLLGSLSRLKPFNREAFVCPQEQSFRVSIPKGWRVDSTIHAGNNQRRPMCRVFGDPTGQIQVAFEPEMAMFLDSPDIAPPPKEEGFFAKVSRFAKHTGQALSTAMGQPPMPFDGLRPVAERHFFPRIQQQHPGTEFISFHDFKNPQIGQMRLRMPDGSIRVVLLEGARLPQMGPKTWGAVQLCWYQAPADVMARFESVLRGVVDGFQINPAWQANEVRRQQQVNAMRQQQMAQQQRQRTQMMQQQHQHNMQMLQSQAAASNAMYQANQEVMDIQMQGWQERQTMQDVGHHNTVQTIREVTDYAAPAGTVAWNSNGVLEVSSHHEHVWSDPQGQLFAGDWSVDVPADWEELRPLN